MESTKTQYRKLDKLNLPALEEELLKFWKENEIFEESINQRADAEPFIFYEGPPSVNGMPGIHHVMGRTIKDMYCRYHSLKGKKVVRKAGWDTHGLPIELAVEKKLGITKVDIGTKITVEQYNQECRKEAMKYIDVWNKITERMGYWVDLDDPYVTYENEYIESLWNLLQRLYNKGLLYKGYTVQPFSPAAGTGLSSHELNQPGCYRDVKDNSATAQFTIKRNEQSETLFTKTSNPVYFLAWTTTPWTLPSNTALALGKNITYVQIDTFNRYTHKAISVIIARDRVSEYFKAEEAELALADFKAGDKLIPYQVVAEYKGSDLKGIRYEQLFTYAQPEEGDAFIALNADFVTTDSGTGIVHLAPSFGADDMMVARKQGIGALTLVNRRGRFVDAVTDFADRPVKNYDSIPDKEYRPVDVDIIIKMKNENKAFRAKKYEHSYPHCWRTDKPIIYYPLDSWFIKTTACKERMVELNKTINWKPRSTGEGRFGNWLENLVDWNLSRSRFWGTPLPIWRTDDGEEELCIGSIAQLKSEVEKSVAAGFMEGALSDDFDLHRPYVDDVFLVSPTGKKMTREKDLIDVWFDSGAMPYAQWHYPFENEETFKNAYPASFIAEGVDQTRGWFFTLHAIAVMLFDSVAFKAVVSNGLLLDKEGKKMSKRTGNVVDPFEAIGKYGADANRWYMISNSPPWDNLRFSLEGVDEVRRKFFGTLYNTYSFFTLYANVDGFSFSEAEIPVAERPEMDRWVISLLNSLIKDVDALYNDYEATKATRLIQDFVGNHLSNWYVRLNRRRFWKGSYGPDKIAAYQTLYQCLETIAQLMSPVAPFFGDFLFQCLNNVSEKQSVKSVHLSDFPTCKDSLINPLLEERMQMAQDLSSMVLSLRKKVDIKVRQPLQKILVPILNDQQQNQIAQIKDWVLSEVNVKDIEYVSDTSGIVTKNIKPDFSKLGRKLGKKMKQVGQAIGSFSQDDIAKIEQEGVYTLHIEGEDIPIQLDEVLIASEDIEGWLVNSMDGLTVALDVTLTDELKQEGFARELVNRLQNLRKQSEFDVTDRIKLAIEHHADANTAIAAFKEYICTETLAEELIMVDKLSDPITIEVNDAALNLTVERV